MLMGYTKQPDRLHANEPGPSSSAPPEVYDTFLTSCISRVKEVLPDYEDDYIAACLKECGLDPTKVCLIVFDQLCQCSMPQQSYSNFNFAFLRRAGGILLIVLF